VLGDKRKSSGCRPVAFFVFNCLPPTLNDTGVIYQSWHAKNSPFTCSYAWQDIRNCFSSVQIYFPIFLVRIFTVTAMGMDYLELLGLQGCSFTSPVFL